MALNDLPLLLAGPILRRVEAGLVCVWLAAREQCSVRLQVYEGFKRATELAGATPVAEAEAKTIRIGAQLHIAVVTARPKPALLPERNYVYNLTLSGAFGARDLAALHFLQDCRIGDDGALVTDPKQPGKVNLALGYQAGFLPSFALPPLQLTDLRLIHGSCRRASKDMPDGLAWVDDFVADARTDPKQRPHQLLLSGDQIYADDVAAPLLHMLNDASRALIGSRLDESEERVPVEQLPAATGRHPADLVHFPANFRQSLCHNDAKLTSTGAHNHLLSLGEYCAMYLFSWSNACWPAALPDLAPFFPPFAWLGRMPGRLRAEILGEEEREQLMLYARMGLIPPQTVGALVDLGESPPEPFSEAENAKLLKERKRNFDRGLAPLRTLAKVLPKVRRALANVPTYMMFDDHEVTDDWNLNPLWRDRVFTSPLGRTVLRNGLLSYALFQGWGNDPDAFEKGERKKLLEHASELFPEGATQGPDAAAAEKIDTLLGLDGKDPPIKWHYSVRGPKHLLLAIDNRTRRSFVSRIGPPGNVSLKAMKEQIPDGPLPSGLEVLVVIAPLPVIGPPILDDLLAPIIYRVYDAFAYKKLARAAGSKDMAGTNPDAIEAWAFDPNTFEALLRRLEPYRRVVLLSGDVHYGSSQAMSYWRDLLATVSAEFVAELDQAKLPESIRQALLTKGHKLSENAAVSVQAAGSRWLITDGDAKALVRKNNGKLAIHRIDNAPARYAQFTSSGMRNVMPWYIRMVDRSLAFGQRLIRADIGTERLGWDKNAPAPLQFPEGAEVVPALRKRLAKSPVMVPTDGWPEQTTFNAAHPPDWSWRVSVQRDQRPDAKRPQPARPAPLDPARPDADIDADVEGYRRVVVRQARQLDKLNNSRQILFVNNLGLVRFEQRSDVLHAIQELYTAHPDGSHPDKAELYTLHEIALDAPGEEKPQVKFAPEGGS